MHGTWGGVARPGVDAGRQSGPVHRGRLHARHQELLRLRHPDIFDLQSSAAGPALHRWAPRSLSCTTQSLTSTITEKTIDLVIRPPPPPINTNTFHPPPVSDQYFLRARHPARRLALPRGHALGTRPAPPFIRYRVLPSVFIAIATINERLYCI